jgi:hypothetical protein
MRQTQRVVSADYGMRDKKQTMKTQHTLFNDRKE